MTHHRVLFAGLLAVSVAAACAAGVAETMHQSALDTQPLSLLPSVAEAMVGLAWASMGALLDYLGGGHADSVGLGRGEPGQ